MAKILDLQMEDEDELCKLGKALSSPQRLAIIRLLYDGNFSITQIAEKLGMPGSSAAFHLNLLEEAGLVRMEEQPGSRGRTKLCSRRQDFVNLCLLPRNTEINEVLRVELPVGEFFSCRPVPTCGLCSPAGVIGMEDAQYSFYLKERSEAGLLYSSAGEVEYRFANQVPARRRIRRLTFSMELCSEAPGYDETWKSDITVWVNGVECATWRCPGDFGARRGRLTPALWGAGSTQYGLLTKWELDETGTYINGVRSSDVRLAEVAAEKNPFISLRIGNKEQAQYVGGFNLFGRTFGDYPQDIVMEVEY